MVEPITPSANAWVSSEKQVTPTTQAKAIGRARSCTQREIPDLRAAESGSELPAMKPAMQAKAWRASTSELRPMISAIVIQLEPVRACRGRYSKPRSAPTVDATAQTAHRSSTEIAAAPANQEPRTGTGSRRQRSSADRVLAIPWVKAYSLALIA